MEQDQIQKIVDTALTNIKNATEINSIVGQPLMTMDGATILPISQVTFGFLAGAGEYNPKPVKSQNPFAGGSGGGASLSPIGFLVIKKDSVKLIKVNETTNADKLIELTKNLLERFGN